MSTLLALVEARLQEYKDYMSNDDPRNESLRAIFYGRLLECEDIIQILREW